MKQDKIIYKSIKHEDILDEESAKIARQNDAIRYAMMRGIRSNLLNNRDDHDSALRIWAALSEAGFKIVPK